VSTYAKANKFYRIGDVKVLKIQLPQNETVTKQRAKQKNQLLRFFFEGDRYKKDNAANCQKDYLYILKQSIFRVNASDIKYENRMGSPKEKYEKSTHDYNT